MNAKHSAYVGPPLVFRYEAFFSALANAGIATIPSDLFEGMEALTPL